MSLIRRDRWKHVLHLAPAHFHTPPTSGSLLVSSLAKVGGLKSGQNFYSNSDVAVCCHGDWDSLGSTRGTGVDATQAVNDGFPGGFLAAASLRSITVCVNQGILCVFAVCAVLNGRTLVEISSSPGPVTNLKNGYKCHGSYRFKHSKRFKLDTFRLLTSYTHNLISCL